MSLDYQRNVDLLEIESVSPMRVRESCVDIKSFAGLIFEKRHFSSFSSADYSRCVIFPSVLKDNGLAAMLVL